MSLSDESLFREVDEEVRRQKIQDLWKRWGNLFIAVSLAVIAVVAGYKGWQFWELKRSEAAARDYFAAVELAEQGKSAEASKKFAELAAGGHPGYRLLARMNMAGDLAAAGKKDEAVKTYDEIAADASIDRNLRNATRIRAAYLLVDTATHDEIVRRVSDLNTPDNAWRNEAREILALAAYRAKDYSEADRLMNEAMIDQETPPNLRQRAQLMISLLAPHLDAKKSAAQ
jgi:hypothetical protein